MRGVSGVQTRLTRDDELIGATVEHIGRCEQRQARVLVMIVVPVEEFGAPGACMLHATETAREIGLVLECLELRLGEGVVVGHARSTMTGIDTELGQQIEEPVCGHRRAAVLMHTQASRFNAMPGDCVGEQLLGERTVLPTR